MKLPDHITALSIPEKMRIIMNWGYNMTYSVNQYGIITQVHCLYGNSIYMEFKKKYQPVEQDINIALYLVYAHIHPVVDECE